MNKMRIKILGIFYGRRWILRGFSSQPLRVCMVGSGPAGFYLAEKLLKTQQVAEVDIIDRLPTPFGLVRSGVAPDHPETKIVVNQFSRVASNERCSFFGNVRLGTSLSLSELHELYRVVITDSRLVLLAYGAESDKVLGVPGEDLDGIHSREFVWWYNGHPDYCNFDPDLQSTDTAVILGQGNVALDVARILLRSTSDLAKTDIADHALLSLQDSSIRKVCLVGRRGPVQAAFTAKELREIVGLKDVYIHIQEADLLKSPADEDGCGRKVTGICCEKTILKANVESSKHYAIGTGEFEDLECCLVLKSIGYKSVPVDVLPFDPHKGVVPNLRGRVLSNASTDPAMMEKGLYVVGWLKRGPTGIIATNLYCAEETVGSILEDQDNEILTPSTPK